MRFAQPQVLWLLLVLPPALLALLAWAARERRRRAAQFIQARLLPALTVGLSPTRQRVRAALLGLAVALLVVALARPQWGFDWQEVRQRGVDIVIAMDTSKSMLAEDIPPNRLARAKLAALDLVRLARSDRVGLVVFAGVAFLQCPLTLDDQAFRQSLDLLDVHILPQGGTALAEAIEVARTAFKEGDNYKVLVIFSDGEDHDSGAVDAAQRAAREGLRIFTIGLGTPEGDLLRVRDAQGRADYLRDPQGAVVKSRLNEPLLQAIAGAANGFYLPLRGAHTMETLYEKGIAPLPKTESEARLVKRYYERYHWPLGLALLVLLAETLWPERARARAPAAGPVAAARAARGISVVVAVGMLAGANPAALASPSTALRHYRAGQFEDALQAYREAIKQKPDDARLQFNAGTAAYRATNYPAALQHFTAALRSPDVKLQAAAYYNLGVTQFRQGEMAEDLDELQARWEAGLKSFQNAVTLNPADDDAAHNRDFVQAALTQLQQWREAARQARAAADAELRRRNYRRGREIMESLVQTNPAAKPFAEFTRRLGQIDDIANPDQP